jgi:glucokinase
MPTHGELHVLVYDVGGSHISAARCHRSSWKLDNLCSASYPPTLAAEGFLDLLYSLGNRAAGDPATVGGAQLAVPAPFDYETGISHMRHKFPFLYGVSLRDGLASRFGWQQHQVRFLHDAAAFLLGEIHAGAARGASRAVGITLGTGIGSGFSQDGRILTDGHGVPPGGEIWSLPVAGGILEDLLSARAIQKEYKQRTGLNRDVASLAAAAPDDPAARETFIDFGRRLGQTMRAMLSDFAPDVIVLGGGISHAAPLFLQSAQRELEDMKSRLEVSSMLDCAALVGAGAAWFNDGRSPHASNPEPVPTVVRDDAV